jgi:hypothetical protein
MRPALNAFRAAAAAIVLAAAPLAAGSALASQPSPLPGASSSKPATGDRITAGIIVRELRAMGFQTEVRSDDKGNIRIATKIDGYKWVIDLYGCTKTGEVEDRTCTNAMFASGYIMENAITAAQMNEWNMKKRFARAYVYNRDDGKYEAVLEVDVYFADTGADPAKSFREHFEIMRHQVNEFRKHIQFS